jgi:hypothetical protein
VGAGHHLFFLENGMRYRRYVHRGSYDPLAEVRALSWEYLIASYDQHACTLALQGRYSGVPKPSAELVKMIEPWVRVVSSIKAGEPLDRYHLSRAAYLVVSHGTGLSVRFAQEHLEKFAPFLSPQYRVLLPSIQTLHSADDELLFHGCSPDLYLWLPPAVRPPQRLLVCFATKSNTLNAPMPLAHTVLARLGVAVLYVYNRRGIDSSRGLAGYDFQQTVDTIRFLIRKFAFQKVYGMGTSLGGYAVCAYAAALGMRRVINFSGSRTHELMSKESPLTERLNGYPLGKIMTVASQADKTDIEILEGYDRRGFLTPRTLLNTPTHGSFTGAWLEGKLPALFTWLLGSPSLTSQKAP